VPGTDGVPTPPQAHTEDVPSAGPSVSEPHLADHPVPLASKRARVFESPREPLAQARERLRRLVPGTDAAHATQPSARLSAGHRALRSAITREAAEVLAAAAALASGPAAAGGDTRLPDARPVPPVVEPTQTPGPPADSPVAKTGPASEAARPRAAWATPPQPPQKRFAAPRGKASEESPGPPRHRRAGETAPEFLLRTPPSVAPAADDFFNGLVRRIEGDR
jgi:hypothetical protein